MKKLLLALSVIALPLIANIRWDSEKKICYSDHFMWSDKLDRQRYHQLALVANKIILNSLRRMGEVISWELAEFEQSLKNEASPEALILMVDLEEFCKQMEPLTEGKMIK